MASARTDVNASNPDPSKIDAEFCPASVEELNALFPDFEVRRFLGRGGMGAVYEAWQKSLARAVALKLLPSELLLSQDFFDRFQREARTMAQMDHPNLARVYDSGITDQAEAYIVMELIDGEPITSYAVRRQSTLSERLQLFIQVCSGVQHAHQKGIIHRDLKPSNILVMRVEGQPTAKVIDFGLAKPLGRSADDELIWLSAQHAIGTPAYMSPEQAAGEEIDSRSDVYSLGALLYELLTGQALFDDLSIRGAAPAVVESVIRTAPVPIPSAQAAKYRAAPSGHDIPAKESASRGTIDPDSLRGDLDAIVLKAVKKNPAHRYETAAALANDVRAYLANQPVSAVEPTGLYLTRKFCRRHRVALGIAGVFVLLILAGLALVVHESLAARRAERLAEERLRQGERLIDFMLGDLHGKLQTVGRIDVLEGTVAEVEQFYAQRSATNLSPESLRNRGRAMFRLGQIRNAQAQAEAAKSHYEEAIRIYHEAIALRPGIIAWKEELGRTWNSLAVFHHMRGEWPPAEAAYGEALKLADNLLKSEPNHSPWAEFKASLLHNFASLCEATARLHEAEKNYEEALHVWEPLLARSPENTKLIENLSHLYLNLAFLQSRRGRIDKVKESNAEALRFRERLLELEPNNTRALWLLADVQQNISEVYMDQGNLEEAERWMSRYRPVREQLAARDPENADWQRSLADAWRNFGVLETKRNHLEASAEAHRKAWEISEAHLGTVAASGIARLRWVQGLKAADETFSRLVAREKEKSHLAVAQQHARTLVEIRAKLANETPNDFAAKHQLALALFELAELDFSCRDVVSARQHAYLALLLWVYARQGDASISLGVERWKQVCAIVELNSDLTLNGAGSIESIRAILARLTPKTTVNSALAGSSMRWPTNIVAEFKKLASQD